MTIPDLTPEQRQRLQDAIKEDGGFYIDRHDVADLLAREEALAEGYAALREALAAFFRLPNWENRGPHWTDISEGLHNLRAALAKYPPL